MLLKFKTCSHPLSFPVSVGCCPKKVEALSVDLASVGFIHWIPKDPLSIPLLRCSGAVSVVGSSVVSDTVSMDLVRFVVGSSNSRSCCSTFSFCSINSFLFFVFSAILVCGSDLNKFLGVGALVGFVS